MAGTGILSNNMRSPLPKVTRHSGWWPSTVTPSIDQALLQFFTLLPNLTFYLIARGIHRTFAKGAACQQRTLTPPDTWSCPTLGLASVLMLKPISLVLFLDFWVTNIFRYLFLLYRQCDPKDSAWHWNERRTQKILQKWNPNENTIMFKVININFSGH